MLVLFTKLVFIILCKAVQYPYIVKRNQYLLISQKIIFCQNAYGGLTNASMLSHYFLMKCQLCVSTHSLVL